MKTVDENRVPTLYGVSSVDNATPIQIAVDSLTGYLLADVYIESLTDGLTTYKEDENRVVTSLAISNDVNQTIRPLIVSSSGRVLIDYA